MSNSNAFPAGAFPTAAFPDAAFPQLIASSGVVTGKHVRAGIGILLSTISSGGQQISLQAQAQFTDALTAAMGLRPSTLGVSAGVSSAVGLNYIRSLALSAQAGMAIGLSVLGGTPVSGNTRWLVNNYIDWLVTSLTTNTGLAAPLSNLKDPRRRLQAIFTSTSNVQVTADLGSSQAIQAVAFCGTNLRAGATVEVRSSQDNFQFDDRLLDTIVVAAPPFTLGWQATEYCHYTLFSTFNARYWRLVLNDAGNPAGQLNLGRVYIGPALEFSQEIDPAITFSLKDPSVSQRAPGGTLYADRRATTRGLSIQYNDLPDTEVWQNMLSVAQQLGTGRDLWMLLQPSSTGAKKYQNALYGRFSSLPTISWHSQNLYNSEPLVFGESL